MLLGVDVGGTFTDAVLAVDGRLVTAKAPSTPHDQSEGVLAAVDLALRGAGRSASDVEAFAHGTTVATNALLEGRAARTALVATAGFEDLVELGRQARPELYRLCAAAAAPIVPPERRIGAPERMAPDGPLRPLDDEGMAAVLDRLSATEPEAVAVCLLHSYAHPAHELGLGEAIAADERFAGVHVSLSCEAVGTFREYERAATTEVDASLSPLLSAYLRRLVERSREAGLPAPDVMQSSGGLAAAGDAGAHAAVAVLSGPAGGAAGAAWAAAAAGEPDALCFDMGGTSCDVCVVEGGRVRESSGREVGGRPIALPMLDLHTVGAGGGSIAWADAGGALRAGPRSAGARPGPACYGHGGTEPTVTDANLLLRRLGDELAGGIRPDRAAAERAVGGLGRRLGLDLLACARGIVDVANAEMVRALRVMTVERGVDPRDLALLAFGGAGGLHAAEIADALGMTRVLVPRASGVLAALGLVVSERRHDVQRSVLGAKGDAVAELRDRARAGLGDATAEVRIAYDVRYHGQAFELTVADPADFPAAHEREFGFRDPDGEVEVVTVRATAVAPGPELSSEDAGRGVERTSRDVAWAGEGVRTAVLRGEPAPGDRVEGPAIVELPEATVAVPPGWGGEVLAGGTLRLTR